ncbi:MAG: hypothetical protein ACRDQZ_25910 [Mycobacteriales bacterium]
MRSVHTDPNAHPEPYGRGVVRKHVHIPSILPKGIRPWYCRRILRRVVYLLCRGHIVRNGDYDTHADGDTDPDCWLLRWRLQR